MTDETRENELEDQNGEVLPNREVMSVITTDPSDALIAPGDYSVQPIAGEGAENPRIPEQPTD